MQETLYLFGNIPYKTKAPRGVPLLVEYAQEAIEDTLNDTSVFLDMPKIKDILKIRSESSYGSHKLIVTLCEGVSYPEYMLSARVVALAPKLVNVFFETLGFEEEEEIYMQMQYASSGGFASSQSSQTQEPQTPSLLEDATIISKTRELLGVSYQELGEQVGYDPQELTKALSVGKVSRAMRRALELCAQNAKLKKELENQLLN